MNRTIIVIIIKTIKFRELNEHLNELNKFGRCIENKPFENLGFRKRYRIVAAQRGYIWITWIVKKWG
jgi:hypothetical protein